MAIKFRCPHCQKLLGISTTKAGTTVDCPACGRSVNVPTDGGAAKRTEPKQRSSHDSGLINALRELSALDPQTTKDRTPSLHSTTIPRERESPAVHILSIQPDSGPSPDRDTMRIVPLANTHTAPDPVTQPDKFRSELTRIQPVKDSETSILSELQETAESDANSRDQSSVLASATKPGPHDLTYALKELADVPDAEQSSAIGSQETILPATSKRSAFLPIMFVLPAFAIGLWIGTFWKSSGSTRITESTMKSDDAIAAAKVLAPEVGERQLNGIVRYVDDSKSSVPDAGAVVLLLPAENTTRLRLDARPLRAPNDSKARKAIEAALKILGGSVCQTDSSGQWTATIPSKNAFHVIVISRHRSRTESQSVPADALQSLSSWFDSPLHIVGRLAVQQTILPSASDTDPGPMLLQIEFARSQ